MRSNMLTRSKIGIMDSQGQGDALDVALASSGGFDWITPTVSLLASTAGSVVTFKVPVAYYPTVEILFRKCRIPIYNYNQTGNLAVFDVPKNKAVLADSLLKGGRR